MKWGSSGRVNEGLSSAGARRARRARAAAALVGVLGSATASGACGSSPANGRAPVDVTITAPGGAREAKGPAARDDERAAISIDTSEARPADWLKPPLQGTAIENPLGDIEAPTIGARTAVLSTKAGYFAVDDANGVIGPLRVPRDTAWVGSIGADDAVIAATGDGTLYFAKSPADAARDGGFERRSAVPGATAWDAAGEIVVAAHDTAVSASSDGGKTFKSTDVSSNLKVLDVVTRADGVMAALVSAVDARKTVISRDGGRSWRASAFQPIELTRDGAWIWNGSDRCPAVLSADGQQWTTAADPAATLDEREPWSSSLILEDTSHPLARKGRVTSTDPPAPAAPDRAAAATGQEKACRSKDSALGGIMGLMGTLGGRNLIGCQGATCLRADIAKAPEPPRFRVAIFNNATCEARRAHPDGLCKTYVPLTPAKPTLAIIDQESGAVSTTRAPEACDRPIATMSAGGIGLLFCSTPQDDTAVFATDERGAWLAEGSLSVPAEALTSIAMAEDGTILVEADPILASPIAAEGVGLEPLLSFVRRPLSLGDKRAWRRLEADGAVAFRPLPGGAALVAISPVASGGKKLSLVLSRAEGPPEPLVQGADVDRNLMRLEVNHGRIVLSGHPRFEMMKSLEVSPKDEPKRLIVTRAGRIAPDWQ